MKPAFFDPVTIVNCIIPNFNLLMRTPFQFFLILIAISFGAKSQTSSYCFDKITGYSIPFQIYPNSSLHHADLNNDGNIDLIACSWATAWWYFYKNNGNGTFVKQDSLTASTGTMVIADIDNDGKKDLIGVGWYALNIGNFKFTTPAFLAVSSSSVFADASDMNGDGYVDIVAASQNTVSIFVNNQAGGFNAPLTNTISSTIYLNDLKIMDYNKDGLKDILLLHAQIGVLKSTGILTFSPYSVVSTFSACPSFVSDLNNDGYEDLVCSKSIGSKDLVYFLNNGSTFQRIAFSIKMNSTSFSNYTDFTLADFNNDGYQDVAAYSYNSNSINEMATVINNANGTFHVQNVYKAYGLFYHFDAFDSDNDSEPEVVTALAPTNDKIVFFHNYGNGRFDLPKTYSYGGGSLTNLVTGDFDNDFDTDVICFDGKPFILENNNRPNDTSYYVTPNVDSAIAGAEIIAKGDFDNDGLLDIAAIGWNSFEIVLNNGGLKFKLPLFYALPGMPSGITVSDFNNDSRLDLAICYSNLNKISTFINLGALAFNQITTTTPININNDLTSGDFDNDGINDIAMIENLNVRIFKGLGTGNFNLAVTYPTTSNLHHIKACSLNMDGNPDLLAISRTNSSMHTFFGTGTGTFTGIVNYTTGNQPEWADVADINGDGKADILIINNYYSMAIHAGLGSNMFSAPPQTFYFSEPGYGIAATDMNGDGTKEILINSTTGLSVLTNYSAYLDLASSYTLCAGQNLTLHGANMGSGTTYTWMPGNITADSLVVTAPGNYYVDISNGSLGCSSVSNTISVITSTATPASLAITGGPHTTCSGDSVKLSVSTPFKPYWITGDTTYTIIRFPVSSSVFKVSAIDYNGCNISDTFMVNVKPAPVLSVVSPSMSICIGKTSNLIASGASTYTWSSSSNSPSIAVSPSVTSTYSVAGTNTLGCTAGSTITIIVNPSPTVSVSCTASVICIPTTCTLTASGAGTYTWSNSTYASTTVISPTATTVYTLTGKSTQGCLGTASISITANPSPTVSLVSSNNPICSGQTATLTAGGALTYTWNTGANTSAIVVSPLVNTNYTVTGSNSYGCTKSVIKTETVSACTDVEQNENGETFSTLFPNPTAGRFTVRMGSAENCSVEVYNSFGMMIIRETIVAGETVIDLSESANGIYIVVIARPQRTETFRVIKE